MNNDEAIEYLKRIKYPFPYCPQNNLASLEMLQRLHVFNVPFEDLDVYYGAPVVLYEASIFEKVVNKKRGGYCYELNGLFYHLLKALGFKVNMVSGRVFNAQKVYGPEFDHMALTVEIEDRLYLVDIGFGDFSVKPLLIECNVVQSDWICNYIISDNLELDGKKYLTVAKWNDGRKQFVIEYAFTTQPHPFEAFEGMNNYQQISPDSHFVQNLMCSLPTENGRISIVNNRVIETANGIKRAKLIHGDEHLQLLLKRYFNICFNVPANYSTR